MHRRKSICILAFSPIARDGRVLRQIQYLSPDYDLTVIGYGAPHPDWANDPHVRWVRLPRRAEPGEVLQTLKEKAWLGFGVKATHLLARSSFRAALYLGQIQSRFFDWGYTLRWQLIRELRQALAIRHDAYHANDWDTVLLAAHAAQRHKAKLVVDLHEYGPEESSSDPNWKLYRAMIVYMLRTYATKADATVTVAPAIARRYQEEFGLQPLVVLNTPDQVTLPEKKLDSNHIRLIHHGSAARIRQPEVMIRTLALCDPRYTLHFMFTPSDYVIELKQLAQEIAPERIFFHDPVAPGEIVHRISEFDVGLPLLPPQSYNDLMALPNKLFEFIAAGLAVCVGPSPSMIEFIEKYGVGCIASSFEPQELAHVLNRTTSEEWNGMQQAARQAASVLNAQNEMAKVVQLYAQLLGKSTLNRDS